MKLGIMQPYFFPYLGYWQLMNAVDKYVIYDDVNYIKGGWINRNRILVNGKPAYIIIPLRRASQNKLINELDICDDPLAKRKIMGTLHSSYSKAPYWSEIKPILEEIMECCSGNLAQFLEYQIKIIAQYLGIQTEFFISSQIEKDHQKKGEEKIIEICEVIGADAYINPIGGQALYSPEHFDQAGLQLQFLKCNDVIYRQYSQEFVPNLSIVDVLMFNNAEQVQKMLGAFSLL